jgi:hypothetical protein
MTTTAAGGAGELPLHLEEALSDFEDEIEFLAVARKRSVNFPNRVRIYSERRVAMLRAILAYAAQARAQAFEECAQVCDAHAKEYSDYSRRGSYEEGHFDAGCVLEEQIRALLPQPGSNADERQP